MLGIDDPWIWGVYLLCILSALLCLIYGIINWNREGELEAIEIKEEAARLKAATSRAAELVQGTVHLEYIEASEFFEQRLCGWFLLE